MAFDATTTMRAIESYLLQTGMFRHVQIGEPKQPPQGISAAIFMSAINTRSLSFTAAVEIHVVMVRLYHNLITDPAEVPFITLDDALLQLEEALHGDFTLEGTIRDVDFNGIHGAQYDAVFGYLDLSGVQYRVADVTIPLIVDSPTVMAA